MQNNHLSIRILNNTNFSDVYGDFLLNKNMNYRKYVSILSIATIFINSSNEIIRQLGYRIIVIYCNRTKDYKPLYEVSINKNLVPISQFIEEKLILDDDKNFYTEMNASCSKRFVINNVFCSLQQKELIDFYNDNNDNSISVVAPTSYGKTDLILHTINSNKEKNICVITPTKSLLAQTKSRILSDNGFKKRKILTNPEMFNNDEDNLLVLMTQERVLRLLQKSKKIYFDYVIIDEAHGLLNDDDRNILLASAILILEKRNKNTVFKFLTPFLCEANNIKVKFTSYSLKTYKVDEYIKTERLYIADLRSNHQRELVMYDQFVDKFYKLDYLNNISEWDFIGKYSGGKNIIYFNKPKDIETFARLLILNQKQIVDSKLNEACNNIAEYVHPKYMMIDCLKRGMIYHHGSVSEPIRMYVEKLYSEIDAIKYVITSSTLLEGVNLPAEKMFIMDDKKGNSNLSPSDFKNLIGRVCRFGQIFDRKRGSLSRLEPEIFLVAGKYFPSNANVEKFIRKSMYVDKEIKDNLENVLLEKTEISQKNIGDYERAQEFVENYESGAITEYNLRKVKTEIGKICFANNITEFDVFDYEEEIEAKIIEYKINNVVIGDTDALFRILGKLFFDKVSDNNLKRFIHEETIRFYKMFLEWRISNISLNQMINMFVKYWKQVIKDKHSQNIIFVGRWGDLRVNGVMPMWTDISNKTDDQLINLAIVRIKEEQDFFDNKILKYIEVLNDLKLLDDNFYLQIKYGTNDEKIITCVKNGMSLYLSRKLIETYFDYVEIDIIDNTVYFKENIKEAMEKAGENEILICELSTFL